MLVQAGFFYVKKERIHVKKAVFLREKIKKFQALALYKKSIFFRIKVLVGAFVEL